MVYDLMIIGAGPAGLNASLYASRYGIKNIVFGESGGLTMKTHEIGNWLGTPKISGWEFAQKATEHAKSYGVEILVNFIDHIESNENGFICYANNGKKFKGKTILLAIGTKHRKLGVSGEKDFIGKGVSYCAVCDGFFYKEKTVAVIGGSNSAAGAAVYLADVARKVYLIYRGEKIRAENFWINTIEKNSKIEIIINTNIKEIKGKEKVESILLDNTYKNSNELLVDGVFVEIGFEPDFNLIRNLGVETDEEGYIRIDADGKTSLSGVWAAGDITTGSNKFKQIITAASEGAIAVNSIQKYLKTHY